MDSDLDLCRRAATGDVAAFERLYRGHCAAVHALARRLCGQADADDQTQEVFVRAWQRLGQFRGEAPFGSWLRRLAANALLNHLRRRHGPVLPGLEPAAAAAPPHLRLDLEDAIATLPMGARAVFVLHDVEGHDHAEIAALLGVSVGTSKSQLHRARSLLRALLDEACP